MKKVSEIANDFCVIEKMVLNLPDKTLQRIENKRFSHKGWWNAFSGLHSALLKDVRCMKAAGGAAGK